jgi:cell fate regulator YaaT (PSP1 superfamily)
MTALTRQITYDPAEYVISVSFTKVGKLYHFDFFDYPDLNVGDQVIVETKMLGIQMGEVKSFKHKDELDSKRRIYNIARPASPADLLLTAASKLPKWAATAKSHSWRRNTTSMARC